MSSPPRSLNSVYYLLDYHTPDRDVFKIWVALNIPPELARMLMAVMNWLNDVGVELSWFWYVNLYTNSPVFMQLKNEVEMLLRWLRFGEFLPPEAINAIPMICSLSTREHFNMAFFYNKRSSAAELIVKILSASRFFLDDRLFEIFLHYEAARKEARQLNSASPPMPPELEIPFLHFIHIYRVPDTPLVRSIIVLFREDSNLTEQDISFYFRGKWGHHCLHYVETEASPSAALVRVRAVFTQAGYLDLMFYDQYVFRFSVNGNLAFATRV